MKPGPNTSAVSVMGWCSIVKGAKSAIPMSYRLMRVLTQLSCGVITAEQALPMIMNEISTPSGALTDEVCAMNLLRPCSTPETAKELFRELLLSYTRLIRSGK